MSETQSIYQRLISFQGELPAITKEGQNPHFRSKYATLEAIQQAIQPLLKKYGLGYMFTTVEGGLNCTVFDVDNNSIDFIYPVNLVGKPQDVGSAISYAKRYALTAVLGLIVGGEDDDGNKANDTQETKQQTKQQVKSEHYEEITKEQATKIVHLLANPDTKAKGYAFYKKITNKTKIDQDSYEAIQSALKIAYPNTPRDNYQDFVSDNKDS